MTDLSDSAAVRFPPPLVFLGLLLLGKAIDRLAGLPAIDLPWPVGAGIAAGGFAVLIACTRKFARSGQNPAPWTPSNAIIADGIYGYTRNPMYLGMSVMQLGLALAWHSLSGVLLVPLAMALIQTQVIAKEEAYLTRTFGDAYLAYCRQVRRWL